MIENDIKSNIEIINKALEWADSYHKESFPRDVLKNYRRKLLKISRALAVNCSAAVYGESQVGKSYLINSLLSTPTTPFVISNKGRNYSFIDEINPSGGKNTKVESTGVVTRFTIKDDGNEKMKEFVKIRNLSVVDLILLILDSYYNDVSINMDDSLSAEDIKSKLEEKRNLFSPRKKIQTIITEDDIQDIEDYIREVIGNNAKVILDSKFCSYIAPIIQYVPYTNWVDVFGLLWNNNGELNHLFSFLINEYQKLDFQTEVYVPFDAVLADRGTILKIDWLDTVCGLKRDMGKDDAFTDIYDKSGNRLASNFSKGSLSALIAELTFVLPPKLAKERCFLENMDLLDFPGARSREKYKEQQLQEVLPQVLRRGKVAYLFNKYSRSFQISSVLFCHHNDQKVEPSIGDAINDWIGLAIGSTPEKRTEFLKDTKGISPLFFIATKFNLELQREKNESHQHPEKLGSHWKRFDTVIPEIIKPNHWMENWVVPGGLFRTQYFQNIYLLRDFYWSGKNQVFDGYRDGKSPSPEKEVHLYPDYPEFLDDLKKSFLNHPFVKRHFEYPEQAWNDVATLNCDGSKVIIQKLNEIAGVLNSARKNRYLKLLAKIQKDLLRRLGVYYVPDEQEENNLRVRKIIGEIKLSLELSVGSDAETFGRIIDSLMVPSDSIRDIAYDILDLHTDSPMDFSKINFIRFSAGIDLKDDKNMNIGKLCKHYDCEEKDLEHVLSGQGVSIDDIIMHDTESLTTEADVVTKHILDYWNAYVNQQVQCLDQFLPHAEDIVLMLQTLIDTLGIRKVLSSKINTYIKLFHKDNLPNAIADFASLLLNNFVCTVGWPFMTEKDLNSVRAKASQCKVEIEGDWSDRVFMNKPHSIVEALEALEKSADVVKQNTLDKSTLLKLPLWDNFWRWENLLVIGFLLTSDVTAVNPEANGILKVLLDQCKGLYQS